MTAGKQLVCVEVVDKGFIELQDFPKEGSFILLDNIGYLHCVQVSHQDLSI